MSLFTSKNSMSIDFGESIIKVVEGKCSIKRVIIEKNISIPVPIGVYGDGIIKDMDQLSYILRQGLSDNSITLGDVYGVINSSKVIIREVIIPKVDDNQIASIIKYQLEDYIPVNAVDYIVNFLKLGYIIDEGIEKLNLLLVAIPKNIIEQHFNLLKNIGLKPVVLDYSGNSLRKLLVSSKIINDSIELSGSIAIIDLGFNSSAITIIREGIIKISRLENISAKSLIDSLTYFFPELTREEIDDRFRSITDVNTEFEPGTDDYKLIEATKTYINSNLNNIEMMFRYFSTIEIGNDVDLILLMGGLSNIEGIDKLFFEFFNKPTIRLNSLDNVSFNGELYRYANAIGGLIRIHEVK